MLIVRDAKKRRRRWRRVNTALGDWFATALFWRPQVVLFVNERTLLPVFIPLVPASSLLDRAPAAIEPVLRLHDVDEEIVVSESGAMRDSRIAPTNNRSVVGVMNEFAFIGEAPLRRSTNSDTLSPPAPTRRARRTFGRTSRQGLPAADLDRRIRTLLQV